MHIQCGGKFDQNKNNALPYSAVAEALSKLAQHARDSKHASSIMSAIKQALGEEDMQLVGKAMPGCQKLFLTCPRRRNSLQLRERDISIQSLRSYDSNAQTQRVFGKEAVNRLQYAITRLMKAICSHLRVVMFIDDLQWADSASLGKNTMAGLCSRQMKSHIIIAFYSQLSNPALNW